jgi:hypothetical protein
MWSIILFCLIVGELYLIERMTRSRRRVKPGRPPLAGGLDHVAGSRLMGGGR